jgi:hypothetical protein
MSVNLLLNYYLENDYLNLTNNINLDELLLLIESIKKYNIIIHCINIPNEFRYIDIIKKHFNDVKIIILKHT